MPDQNTDIREILKERGSRYGEFLSHAIITQSLKSVMHETGNWQFKLAQDQRECLDMIAHKIGRILNGDPNYLDSWIDIIGYTQLVINEIEQNERE